MHTDRAERCYTCGLCSAIQCVFSANYSPQGSPSIMPTAPRKPVSVDQAITIARNSAKTGKFNDAKAILTKILEQQPQNLKALHALGDLYYNRRQFGPASQVYGRAVQLAPKNPQMYLLLGNALQSGGKSADALKVFTAVLKLKPRHAIALNNLGNAYQSLRQFANAVKAYQQSLAVEPRQTLANYNLGLMLLKQNKLMEAQTYLHRTVEIDPKHVPATHNLGVVQHRLRRHKDAEASFRKALKLQGNYAPALQSMGALLADTGRLPDALVTLRAAEQFAPKNAQNAFLIGNVFRAMGKPSEGMTELTKALKIEPKFAEARISLAQMLLQQDKSREAATILFTGLSFDPNNKPLRRAAAAALRDLTVTAMSGQSLNILVSMINDPAISTQEIGRVVIGLVRNAAYFNPLLKAAEKEGDILETELTSARAMMSDPILLAALPRMVMCDPDIEAILTAVRRAFLLRITETEFPFSGAEGVNGPFLSALARQLFAAEYSFFVEADEQSKIDEIGRKIEEVLASGIFTPSKLEWALGVYSLYAPISSLRSWEKILGTSLATWSRPLQNIIREQVFERERENEISRSIPAITPVHDATSKDFLALYDANPYPRWRSLSVPVPETIEGFAARLRPGAPAPVFPKPAPILIAGCGTGHHPIQVALRFPQSQVTALDLSTVSLGYGARMAERFNVGSILWRQGDMLELGAIQEKFAIIECGGVLHHVNDPEAAVALLRDRLLPGGMMKLGVYSTIARKHVEPARAFVKQQGFPDTPEGIRAARRAIRALPAESPEREVMSSADFYSTSGCRFIAFPVREHTFTLSQVASMLDRLNLRFLSFDLPARTHARFRAAHPSPNAASDLSAWEKFEETEPLTFRKMYQFWVDAK